jgi:chorismate dehydratase
MNCEPTKTAESADNHFCVGTVSFFNARPLTYNMESREDVRLYPEVPARLLEALDNGDIDVGMVPSIDYQRCEDELLILPIGAIGSEGEVLTVRVFSQRPLDEINCLACDSDSHTSVALAGIVWQLRYQRRLKIVPLSVPEGPAVKCSPNDYPEAAILLIGDKVLPQLGRWAYELDLGLAWSELTSLPFVYAFWAVTGRKTDADTALLVDILQKACQEGLANIDTIVRRFAGQHGFEANQASRYLTENISYQFGRRQQQGLSRFYQLAGQLGLVARQRPLHTYSTTAVVDNRI